MPKKQVKAEASGLSGLRSRLEEKGPEPAYLFVGDDRHDMEEALELLEQRLVDPEMAALNAARLRGSETSAEEVLGLCSTLPMMGGRRLVALREPERLPTGGLAALAAACLDPCPSTTLVLVPTSVDRRLSGWKELEKACCVVAFEAPSARDLDGWVRRSLKARNVQVEPEAMELLRDLVQVDTLLLTNELDKLALYCSQSKLVRREDVEALLGRTRTIDVWELTNAIEDARPAAAVAALRRLLEQGAAVPLLVGTLDWCLGRLVGSEPPKAPPGRRRALEQRRRALRGRAAEIYGLLRAADRALRTTGADAGAALERTVLAAAS